MIDEVTPVVFFKVSAAVIRWPFFSSARTNFVSSAPRFGSSAAARYFVSCPESSMYIPAPAKDSFAPMLRYSADGALIIAPDPAFRAMPPAMWSLYGVLSFEKRTSR